MVSDPATGQSRQVDSHRIPAVNRGRLFGVEPESAQGSGGGHIEDEDGAHAVITEALPKFDEKERAETLRMSGKSGAINDTGIDFSGCVHIVRGNSWLKSTKLGGNISRKGAKTQRKPFKAVRHLSTTLSRNAALPSQESLCTASNCRFSCF